jgi:cathepsin F
MNKIIFLAIIGIALTASTFTRVSDDEVFQQFLRFQDTYKKVYKTDSEFAAKFAVFKMNYNKVDTTNFQLNSSGTQPLYQLGISPFMDMTPTEFATSHLNLKLDYVKNFKANATLQKPTYKFGEAPENFDWRERGMVTRVKDQGMCGSCWAFSAIGNIESRYAIKTHGFREFSEQQLVDCDVGGEDQGCNGGLMDQAYKYLQTAGVMGEADYSYTGHDDKCKYDATMVRAKITGQSAAPKDESQIRQLLFENGPYAIAINATPLQFYFWGIFDPYFDFICNPQELNHGVLLVGYGIDRGYPYWIVKNSWGSHWGERGYFRIIANKGACGMDQYVVTAEVEDNKP